jgi:translation initiation factor 1
MPPPASSSRLVYSTDHGRICPDCRQPQDRRVCKSLRAVPAGDGIVRVRREVQGRGGKAVTVVRGVPLDTAGLKALGQELKAACGSGGTVKDGVIEVQGDHVERVIERLQARGWVVKRAGG